MNNRAAWIIGKDEMTQRPSIPFQRLLYICLLHLFTNVIDATKSHLSVSLIYLYSFFSYFFFYWHMLCSLNIIGLLCFQLSEALHLKFSNCLILSSSLLIVEPIAHTCTAQIPPHLSSISYEIKIWIWFYDKSSSEQIRSPVSRHLLTYFSYFTF